MKVLYRITSVLRRLNAWARHKTGTCHAWCAHCITEADDIWYKEHGYKSASEFEKHTLQAKLAAETSEYWNGISDTEMEEHVRWAEMAEAQFIEKELDKLS